MLNSCVMVLIGIRNTNPFSWPENPVPGQSWLARSSLCWVYLVANQGKRWFESFLLHIHILRWVPSPAYSTTYAGHESALFSRTPALGHTARSGPKLETLRKWMAFLKHSPILLRISLGRLNVTDSWSPKEGVDLTNRRISTGRAALVNSTHLVYSGSYRALQYHLQHLGIRGLLVSGHR